MGSFITKNQLRAALLGKTQTWLRDTPIRLDVWLELLNTPDGAVSSLLIPTSGTSPAELFKALQDRQANPIAFNQSVVLANLSLEQIVKVVLPLTAWWQNNAREFQAFLEGHYQEPDFAQHEILARSLGMVVAMQHKEQTARQEVVQTRQHDDFLEEVKSLELEFDPKSQRVMIHTVARNRPARCSSTQSLSTVKADAAVRLFDLDFRDITWAVLDTGIDASHPAFAQPAQDAAVAPPPVDDPAPSSGDDGDPEAKSGKKNASKKAKAKGKKKKKKKGKKAGGKKTEAKAEPDEVGQEIAAPPNAASPPSRVVAAYDFRRLTTIMSLASSADVADQALLETKYGLQPDLVQDLKAAIHRGRDINWGLLEEALQILDPERDPPRHGHGTHVAGILGGGDPTLRAKQLPEDQAGIGMCPTISLVDLRVMGDDGTGDEFTVMAALQFVRYLNGRGGRIQVHGVNVSVQIPHDVQDYACGRTPVCDECNRLVASGVCVVAAAGNFGVSTEVAAGGPAFVNYGDSTITDPGNAHGVITVGATHRNKPHTFGVSYFSSRGPTGDGRLKPDLLAPGERIPGPIPGGGAAVMNGTSQAAPHVSGAAAILMARNRELIGQPERIKQILCDTATNLEREPYYQGRGLVDVLRALQAV
ncbi:MAG: S8 family peptidase [Polyangiaceae bacterium]